MSRSRHRRGFRKDAPILAQKIHRFVIQLQLSRNIVLLVFLLVSTIAVHGFLLGPKIPVVTRQGRQQQHRPILEILHQQPPTSPPSWFQYSPQSPQQERQQQNHDGGDHDEICTSFPTTASREDAAVATKRASTTTATTRRNVLVHSTAAAVLTVTTAASALTMVPAAADAVAIVDQQGSTTTTTAMISPKDAVVTDRVFMDVRISRQDGTFYVRDDLPDTMENQVFAARLTLGLFGRNAPSHVQHFLQYVNAGFNPLEDNPLPSYSRSVFTQYDDDTGVLYGGTIPSLEVMEVMQGTTALKYNGRLFPATLWMDVSETNQPKIAHTGTAGLLTHRQLDVTPTFGITTRTDTSILDRTHTVFGKLLEDESSVAFLKRVTQLPTYSVDRSSYYSSSGSIGNNGDVTASNTIEGATQAIFNAQRDFFRGAAQSLGDTRVSKLYEGKLLRRVEVTQVGIL